MLLGIFCVSSVRNLNEWLFLVVLPGASFAPFLVPVGIRSWHLAFHSLTSVLCCKLVTQPLM